jgi:hypothetical protein
MPKSPTEGHHDVTWISAVPDVLVCVGLFYLPGLLATYLGGLRGITAWATAPVVTVGVVAMVAVLGGFFNFRFGLWSVAAGIAVMAGLSAGLSLLLRRHGVERPPRDPRRYSLAVAIGAVAAAVIGGVTFITGIKRPDAISQTWDAVFHYSAVRYIEQTGKASPLTIGTLGQPGVKGSFYPDAWHAMAALLAELTHAPVTVAASVTCLVVAVLVWPLSCLLLARHLFGSTGARAAAAVVVTGMLSSLFGPFPWMMTGWGVLWPNSLGMALAPAGVALGMSITRISDGDSFGARRWFFGLVAAWAIGISHPDSALSVVVICVFPLLIAIAPAVSDQWSRHTLRTTLGLLAVAVVVGLGLIVFLKLPQVKAVEAQYWPPFQSPGQAVVSAVTESTDGQVAEWVLAAFLIIGMIACFVWRQRRWLVIAEVVIVALYVGSAGVGTRFARLFTGLWYDDSHRPAAILPVVGIPLATMGVLAVAELLQKAMHRLPSAAAIAARPAAALAVPLAVGAVVATATAVQSIPDNAQIVGREFSTSGDQAFTSPQKLEFLQTVARLVPGSALVADNPIEGTAYLWALTGTRVLFPQVEPSSNRDMAYLAGNLVKIGRNPRVCDLVRQYDIGYMVVAPDLYLNPWPEAFYAGIANPDHKPGFRLLAADGPIRLYKITMCQPARAAGQVEAASQHGS